MLGEICLAIEMGANAVDIGKTIEALEEAVKAAFAADRPTVIEVREAAGFLA